VKLPAFQVGAGCPDGHDIAYSGLSCEEWEKQAKFKSEMASYPKGYCFSAHSRLEFISIEGVTAFEKLSC
jgi:hypothetical protein